MKPVLKWSLGILSIICVSCDLGKQSAVEGKLVDWNGKPVARAKITAAQIQPIKGYEQFEARTNSDGSFRVTGLFPLSQYGLKPSTDKWTCDTSVVVDSAPKGETRLLNAPMVIGHAFARSSGAFVRDLETGETRYTLSTEGVITDIESGLEWIVGPDRRMDFDESVRWVRECQDGGGGWRMPTQQELESLRGEGIGERSLDPVFRISGYFIWADSGSSSSMNYFGFYTGKAHFRSGGILMQHFDERDPLPYFRAFGVRSRDGGGEANVGRNR